VRMIHTCFHDVGELAAGHEQRGWGDRVFSKNAIVGKASDRLHSGAPVGGEGI
jgi:hypothetical protein